MKKGPKKILFIILGIIILFLLFGYLNSTSYDAIKKEVKGLEETARLVVIKACSGTKSPDLVLQNLQSIEEEVKRKAGSVPTKEEGFITEALSSLIEMKYSIERYKIDKSYGEICVELYSEI